MKNLKLNDLQKSTKNFWKWKKLHKWILSARILSKKNKLQARTRKKKNSTYSTFMSKKWESPSIKKSPKIKRESPAKISIVYISRTANKSLWRHSRSSNLALKSYLLKTGKERATPTIQYLKVNSIIWLKIRMQPALMLCSINPPSTNLSKTPQSKILPKWVLDARNFFRCTKKDLKSSIRIQFKSLQFRE